MSSASFPLALLAELTHRCPLRCPYCSNPLELARASAELGTAAWIAVLEEAAGLGVLQVHFSGGEPTARKDLEELIAAAEALDLYSNLITAGVLLDRARLEGLAERGLQHVQLSIQGAEPENADRIGGFDGGHAKKLSLARAVRDIGLPLTLNAVMHRQSLDELTGVIDLAVELGAQRLEVAHVQYYGWALRNRAALMPTEAQLEAATILVEDARRRLEGVLVIDYVVPDYYARRPKSCMGGWGQRFLVVNPVGKVLPCHAAESIPGLDFERVGTRPLETIWSEGSAFRRFRGTAWMPEPCRSCDRREIDWGGCRCQAFALTGDGAATDPACELSPHHEAMRGQARQDALLSSAEFSYRRFGADKA